MWNEICNQHAFDLLKKWCNEGFLQKTNLSAKERFYAEEVLRRAFAHPEIGKLHMAESSAMIYAKRHNINIVLSENRDTMHVVNKFKYFKGLKIWGALEVLSEAMIQGILEVKEETDIDHYLKEYSSHTRQFFKESHINAIKEKVCIELKSKR
ncbi:MAG: hypothetical protein ACE5KE_08785 [Methanosarcinales archaeon]